MDVGIWTIYNKASHQDHMGNEENLQQQMKYKTRKYVRWNSSLFVNLNKWVKKARRNEWDGASERVRLGQRREVHYVFFILQIDMNELVFFCIYCRHKIITTIRKRLQQYNRRTTDDCKLYARTDTHAKEKNAKSRLGGVGTRECQIATSRQPNILILHSQGVSVYRHRQQTNNTNGCSRTTTTTQIHGQRKKNSTKHNFSTKVTSRLNDALWVLMMLC